MNRGLTRGAGAAALALSCITAPPAAAQRAAAPMTGTPVPELAAFDSLIPALMAKWGVPGGAVAVMKDGKLILARGYGWADTAARTPVEPDALFRIASISKPVTAIAILRLAEEGKLRLDDPVLPYVQHLAPRGGPADARWRRVTLRHLLTHTGGWDRDREGGFDPMFRPTEAARETGQPAPASAETVVRWMLTKRLDFDPGARYAYSNFGYALLGRVIERVTGQPYESYVRERVLRPAGVTRMRIGRSLLAGRAPGEVRYYDGQVVPSVFPGTPARVPFAYGGFHLEAMDAHGGWLASAPDLLRVLRVVDRLPSPPDLLSSLSTAEMIARPAPPLPSDSVVWYALGWQVRPSRGDANWWHGGSLPGTATLLVRSYHGFGWAALFNRRLSRDSTSFAAELDRTMWQALRGVERWPGHDLFEHR